MVPAYLAASTVARVVQGALRHLPVVFVADDGSNDNTAEAAEAAGGCVLRLSRNAGKGAALRALFAEALASGAGAVLTLDADGQHDPEQIPRFLDAHRAAPAAILIGNRMAGAARMPWPRRLANRAASLWISRLAGAAIPDSQCGMRLIPAPVLARVATRKPGFAMETEFLLRAMELAVPIQPVPIPCLYPASGASHFQALPDTARIALHLLGHSLRGAPRRRAGAANAAITAAGS